jgi:DNA-directed RNA polymerase specialized sigma24 family protein
MHNIDGLTVPEISEALGVPLNTVYSRLRRGLADFTVAVRRIRKTYRG